MAKTFLTDILGRAATFLSDIVVHGVRVGRGPGNVDSNTVVGLDALNLNTTGGLNTAVGASACAGFVDNSENTGVGYQALHSASGDANTAIGAYAGGYVTGSNTCIGCGAGAVVTGYANTYLGSFDGNSYGYDLHTLNSHCVISTGSGVPRAIWNALGNLNQVSAGTAALPALFFNNDTDTGIHSPGANQLGFSTNGVNRFTINQDGRITFDSSGVASTRLGFKSSGAGQTVPSIIGNGTAAAPTTAGLNFYAQDDWVNGQYAQALILGSTTSASSEFRLATGAYGTGLQPSITFLTSGVERMRIHPDGDLVVGPPPAQPVVAKETVFSNTYNVLVNSLDLVTNRMYNLTDYGGVAINAVADNGTRGVHDFGSLSWSSRYGYADGGAATFKLHVGGTSSAQGLASQAIQVHSSGSAVDNIALYTNQLARISIDAAGSVYIGETGTAGNLELRSTNGTNEGGQLNIKGAGSYSDCTIDRFANDLRIMSTVNSGDATITPYNFGTGDANIVLNLSHSSAGQIQFPASQNASANANTLDDYEEGSFTPGFATWNTAPTSVTAQYTKVGRLVTFVINGNGGTTGAGDTVTGLPLTAAYNVCCTVFNTSLGTVSGCCYTDTATSLIGLPAITFGAYWWQITGFYYTA